MDDDDRKLVAKLKEDIIDRQKGIHHQMLTMALIFSATNLMQDHLEEYCEDEKDNTSETGAFMHLFDRAIRATEHGLMNRLPAPFKGMPVRFTLRPFFKHVILSLRYFAERTPKEYCGFRSYEIHLNGELTAKSGIEELKDSIRAARAHAEVCLLESLSAMEHAEDEGVVRRYVSAHLAQVHGKREEAEALALLTTHN